MAAENKEARLALARQLVDDLVDAAERMSEIATQRDDWAVKSAGSPAADDELNRVARLKKLRKHTKN